MYQIIQNLKKIPESVSSKPEYYYELAFLTL